MQPSADLPAGYVLDPMGTHPATSSILVWQVIATLAFSLLALAVLVWLVRNLSPAVSQALAARRGVGWRSALIALDLFLCVLGFVAWFVVLDFPGMAPVAAALIAIVPLILLHIVALRGPAGRSG